MNASWSSVIGILVSVVILAVVLGIAALLFWAGNRAARKMTQSEAWQIVLTIVFGIVFNVALATAAVAGCFLVVGFNVH
jgi:hypothetical protein